MTTYGILYEPQKGPEQGQSRKTTQRCDRVHLKVLWSLGTGSDSKVSVGYTLPFSGQILTTTCSMSHPHSNPASKPKGLGPPGRESRKNRTVENTEKGSEKSLPLTAYIAACEETGTEIFMFFSLPSKTAILVALKRLLIRSHQTQS